MSFMSHKIDTMRNCNLLVTEN